MGPRRYIRDYEETPPKIVGVWEMLGRPSGHTVRTRSLFYEDLFPHGQTYINLDFSIDRRPLTQNGRKISMGVRGAYLSFKLPITHRTVDFHRQLYRDWFWPATISSDMEINHMIRVEGQRHRSDNLFASLGLVPASDHSVITVMERAADRQREAERRAAREAAAKATPYPSQYKKNDGAIGGIRIPDGTPASEPTSKQYK